MKRRVAVAIPARDEARRIRACLARLLSLESDRRIDAFKVVVLANNCTDDTADQVRAMGPDVEVVETNLAPGLDHAGGARRAAFDAAARFLGDSHDVLLSTDADTEVACDWLARTLDHLDAGYDAVAGLVRLKGRELRELEPEHRLRLARG